MQVAQDPVGYGIVLRGDGPVFVKAVDPMGPAAKAGLKVPACFMLLYPILLQVQKARNDNMYVHVDLFL